MKAAVHKITNYRVASVSEHVACISDVIQQVRSALAGTSQNMEWQVNHHCRDFDISVSANAWLSIEHLRLPPGLTRKFAPRVVGPFEVLAAITPVLFRLKLPEV